jgi:lipopolysaccharide transport system ATP-binding protein
LSDVAIIAENLSKMYRIGEKQARYKTIRETAMETLAAPLRRLRRMGQPTPPKETVWALNDVSFEVKQGEVLGIIGRNGAGKSTLLKVLARITEPTKGSARINGRVGSLLEVGTGFHPELTGRENIFLNGAILGMTRSEIDRKFDEIVDFAEIEQFLDTPAKRYSSGMYVRLAFAVAAHLEPEILLVDEVLAVGDTQFQKKCLGKMGEVTEAGRTVLFVSHNMAAVSALCGVTLLLESGRLALLDTTNETVRTYLARLQDADAQPALSQTRRSGGKQLAITDLWVENGRGERVLSVSSGEEMSLMARYETMMDSPNLRFIVGVYDNYHQRVLAFDSDISEDPVKKYPQDGVVACELLWGLPLAPGQYRLNIAVYAGGALVDHLVEALVLEVVEGDFFGGGRMPKIMPLFFVPSAWKVEQISRTA